MSSTSEHEPPSAPTYPVADHSGAEAEAGNGNGSANGADGNGTGGNGWHPDGAERAPHDTPSASENAGDQGDDVPDEGPLDPSVFDGLFDDLGSDDGAEPADNPLDEFLRAPLADGDGWEGDPDATADVVLDLDGESDLIAADLEPEPGVEAAPDAGPGPAPVPAAEPIDEPIGGPDPTVEFGGTDDGFHLDGLGDIRDPDATSQVARRADGSFTLQEGPVDGDTVPVDALTLINPDVVDDGGEPWTDDPIGDETEHRDDEHRDDEDWGDEGWGDEGWGDAAAFDQTYADADADGGLGGPDAAEVAEQPAPGGWFASNDDQPTAPAPLGDASLRHDDDQALPRDDAGPYRASPEIQPDPEPEYEYEPVPAALPVDDQPPAPAEAEPVRRSQRAMAALALAMVIGGLAGIGGAVALANLARDDGDEQAAPVEAASDAGADSGEPVDPSGPVTSTAVEVVDPADLDRLELSSLRFTPGADDAPLADSPGLELLGQLIEQDPERPITAVVRTFTETSSAADLARSGRQADTLAEQLVGLGADPAQVVVVGLGRSLLNTAQPVPNFVVPSAGLATTPLAEVAADIGPFAIGLDRATGVLRADSRIVLDRLAQTMVADPDGPDLTLAAYSYDLPTREGNEVQAATAATAAADHLEAAGVDRSRVELIVAADEPFAVPDRVANHIDLRWGTLAEAHVELETASVDRIDFATGSVDLDAEAAAIVDQLAAVLLRHDVEAVLDVHSFDGEASDEAVDLSVRRAQAIGQRLLAAGVPARQLRLHGGASPQFRSEEANCRVVVTLIQPPTRP